MNFLSIVLMIRYTFTKSRFPDNHYLVVVKRILFLNIYLSAQDSTNEITNKKAIGIVDIISISSS